VQIEKVIKDAVLSTLPMFGLHAEFVEQQPQSVLTSAEEVNIHIGFTDGLRGNVLIGLSLVSAMEIVKTMMGGADLGEFGYMAKSALGELANMLVGGAMMALSSSTVINLSAPTIVAGQNMLVVMSRVASTKLTFNVNNSQMVVLVATE